MKLPSKQTQRGFTLIELLVAMAITTLIVTVLVSITSLSLDTWNRSRSELRAARQGKAMLDSMARDFESLVVRRGNNFEWLYAKHAPTASGPKNNASPNAAELVFFTAATDRYNGDLTAPNDKGGDVSTVAYKLSYKDPIGAAGTGSDELKTFVLYRKIINPDVTFSDILGTPFNPTSDALFTRAESASTGPGISTGIDEESNFICENVYQFTLTFHVDVTRTNGTVANVLVSVANSGTATRIFKIAGSGLHMDATITGGTGITNDMVKAGQVTSVEISLTVLTDSGLQQMRRRNFDTPEAKDEFIAKNSYQYSKLVPVPGS